MLTFVADKRLIGLGGLGRHDGCLWAQEEDKTKMKDERGDYDGWQERKEDLKGAFLCSAVPVAPRYLSPRKLIVSPTSRTADGRMNAFKTSMVPRSSVVEE